MRHQHTEAEGDPDDWCLLRRIMEVGARSINSLHFVARRRWAQRSPNKAYNTNIITTIYIIK